MEKKQKKNDIGAIFESMEYFSNKAINDMIKTVAEHQKTMGDWLGLSTDFGRGVKDILEETNEDYENLKDIWTEFEDITEEIVDTEEELGRDLQQEFIEYNRDISEKLSGMVEDSFEKSRELYSSWTALFESFFTGVKAGTGPDYDEIMQAVADFQQTALHIALNQVEYNREEMEALRTMLNEYSDKTSKVLNEAMVSSDKKYRENVEARIEKIESVGKKVNEYLKQLEKRYVSSLEPYFVKPMAMPIFPWLPNRRLREYEQDIESLKKRIEEMENKLREKD